MADAVAAVWIFVRCPFFVVYEFFQQVKKTRFVVQSTRISPMESQDAQLLDGRVSESANNTPAQHSTANATGEKDLHRSIDLMYLSRNDEGSAGIVVYGVVLLGARRILFGGQQHRGAMAIRLWCLFTIK